MKANVHFLDRWEGQLGDTLQLGVDGSVVWQYAHSWCMKLTEKSCLSV